MSLATDKIGGKHKPNIRLSNKVKIKLQFSLNIRLPYQCCPERFVVGLFMEDGS